MKKFFSLGLSFFLSLLLIFSVSVSAATLHDKDLIQFTSVKQQHIISKFITVPKDGYLEVTVENKGGEYQINWGIITQNKKKPVADYGIDSVKQKRIHVPPGKYALLLVCKYITITGCQAKGSISSWKK
ncbi:hypothetical protein [Thermoflavimicrobium dichotomicum]|uniref:Intracellular proteinase inhibitor n=1 Tax=Thermoflavimicrobium dichotomicum TaxID=46223 RepID=A0A1I3TEA8_9BACL|nr:hypothetical protein [Thermoflavimicrobium dichotomicum]SFJ69498.1 hypothetical protein SAMN05421852_11745 [Thermoflavimicrobium dichotomicum]